jgi:phosphatidylinositol glycan class H protein
MLTVAPHLRTRRPSPTTVEYTVSTSPPPTLPLRLLLGFTILLRVTIGLSVFLLLYSNFLLSAYSAPLETYSPRPPIQSNAFIWYLAYKLTNSRLGVLFTHFATLIPSILLLPTSATILYLLHTTESLLVLRGLGIQTSSSSDTFLSGSTTRFIPTEKIQDIFVNEAFRGFEVRYYLVVVVEGEESVVVVFPQLLPRRQIVETVWRGVRGCLFEPEEKDGVRG